jgi:putative DNA primase/helicase
MSTTNSPHIDRDELKARARGHWPSIIASICGIDISILDGRHHPCPKCGGTDRFRMVDQEAGSLFCNQCFDHDNGDGIAAIQWLQGVDFVSALKAIAEYLRITPSTANGKPHVPAVKAYRQFASPQLAVESLMKSLGVPLVKWWKYTNERGVLVAIQTRFNLADGSKEFRPISHHPKGGVAIKAPDGLRPLYRLPELLDSTTVYVCEGEKASDAAVSIGLTATTSMNGAKSPKKTNWKPVKGKAVVILPDNDDPGRKYSETVATLCREAGAASVKILELPGLPDGGDIVEWIEARGDAAEPETMRKELESLVAAEVSTSEKPVDWMSPHTIQGRTDLANGKRFANLMSDSARFCHPWGKWLVWDGTRWKIDDSGAVLQLAKQVPESIWKEAMATPGLSEDAVRFAAVSASQRSLNAAITLAASEPGMSILPHQLDSDPWVLNCINGTIDLRTGKLRPHRREDYISKLCPTEFGTDRQLC